MTTQKTLDELIESLLELAQNSSISAEQSETIKEACIPRLVKKHLTDIINNRSIVLTGDTGHLTIDYLINTLFANIDQPKKYEWQKDDVNVEEFMNSLMRYIPDWSVKVKYDDVQKALAGDKWVTLEGNYDSKCYDCAEHLFLSFKGNEVKIGCDSACSNNRKYTIEVDFPTGVVVYDDWPARFSEARDAGFISERDGTSINYLKGQRERTDEYAAQQIVHHSVGNSCPTFYVNSTNNTIQIGGGTYNEETDAYDIDAGFTDVGSFCTDLWWVTMLDKQFYDAIVSKLPKKRNKKYYKKELNTTTIKPGRYRFTCNSRKDDEDNTPYMTGEWIGECSDFVPAFDIMSDNRMMTLDEAVADNLRRYTLSKDVDGNLESAKFNFLDHVFNVIGNGISSKGEFFSRFSVKNDTVIEPLAPSDKPASKKKPYPNFKKEYSLIYEMPVTDIPTDWLEGVLWYYEECKVYFLNGAEDYYHAYPNKNDTLHEVIERVREGRTESEWHEYVSKIYCGGRCEFTGDYEDWRTRCWAKEKDETIAFIDQTLTLIQDELNIR